MPGSETDLIRELTDAGNRLLSPPDDVDQFLALLDRVERSLSFVEQQPLIDIQDALCPTFKALISTQLLKHPDTDVRVGVVACITEISRITAPDVPYNDDLMKEVFRLTISAFQGLSDASSKSFNKRVSILEIVARVRSCAVLLDLDCDHLVVQMFQIFYKCIRDFHPAIVFASMESIMTLIIEESDEISTDILFALLSVLRKDNKDALPIARKLGQKVMQNCATILKLCIVEAIESLKIDLLDYDFVVTMTCQLTQDHNPLKDNFLTAPLVNGSESDAAVEDLAQEVVAANNCNTEVEEDATVEMFNTSNIIDSIAAVSSAEIIHDAPTPDKATNHEPVSSPKSELKTELVAKKRGRKPKVPKEIIEQTDSGNLSQRGSNKESSEVNNHIESRKAPREDSFVKPNILENMSPSSNKMLSPTAVLNDAVTIGSPSQSDSLPGKSSRKRIRRSKKEILTLKKTQSHQSAENEASNGLNDTEPVCLEKNAPDGVNMASKWVSSVEVKKEQDNEGESDDTPRKQSSLQLGVTDGTPRMKKRGRPRKDASMAVSTGVKDKVSSGGTPSKRPRHIAFSADGKEYGEELVRSRIKVWWPQDKKYYDGIVESFDPVKRKHKILYTDNEREVLNLHKQKWELVTSIEGSEKNEEACHTNSGDSYATQQKKKLKMDSDSVGKMGHTDSPRKRRGRPPNSAASLASNNCAGKGTEPEDKTIDSMADAGSPGKSMKSPSNNLPNLNDLFMDSEQERELSGNDGTQALMDTVAPTDTEAKVGIDINETLVIGGGENSKLDKTATPTNGHANVTEQVKSGPDVTKTEGLNYEISASDTEKNPVKRKTRTNSNSTSPTMPGSPDTSVKRVRSRALRNSLRSSDDKSELLKKQLSDTQVDESTSGDHSNNLEVVSSGDSLGEGQNKHNLNAELKVSEHGILDNNVTKSNDSVMIVTGEDVALEQISCKSASGEPKSSSLTLKTFDAAPELQRRKSRKTISSSTELVKKDGSVKRSRGGRPCKPKIGDPKSDTNENGSENISTPSVCNDQKDSVRADDGQSRLDTYQGFGSDTGLGYRK